MIASALSTRSIISGNRSTRSSSVTAILVISAALTLVSMLLASVVHSAAVPALSLAKRDPSYGQVRPASGSGSGSAAGGQSPVVTRVVSAPRAVVTVKVTKTIIVSGGTTRTVTNRQTVAAQPTKVEVYGGNTGNGKGNGASTPPPPTPAPQPPRPEPQKPAPAPQVASNPAYAPQGQIPSGPASLSPIPLGGPTGSNADITYAMAVAVNAMRVANGVFTPLTPNTNLARACVKHALDMASNNFMGHTGSDQSTAGSRADQFGYKWSSISENVAAGQTSLVQVMESWMNSSGHRANILSKSANNFASGVSQARDGKYYWVQCFGSLSS